MTILSSRMNQFEIKAGDTLPALETVLLDGDGVPFDLTSASGVRLNMVLESHPRTVVLTAAVCTFAADTTGAVGYDWQVGDTDVAGTYNIEWVVLFASGDETTVPSKGFDKVLISPRAV